MSFRELFPTNGSVVIFILYMSLFVAQGLLVKASQSTNNSYTYNTVTVVLATELLKLLVSGSLYYKENNLKSLYTNVLKGGKLLAFYLVPAFLYCLYNNLAFLNLSNFDPTTYFLLLQLRVVFTGILFQVIFSKKLSKLQWVSLILLTFGCMVKHLDLSSSDDASKSTTDDKKLAHDSNYITSIILILIQTLCSCLAGVYNEYLLKKKGAETDIYMQNIFMYLDSLVCNLLLLVLQGDLINALTPTSIQQIIRWDVLLIIVNNCAIGIVTSFFLKYMNSILKTFASALELSFTAILSYVIFAIPLNVSTVFAILIVSFAVFLYSKNPVNNTGPSVKNVLPVYADVRDKQKLLGDDNVDDDDEEYDLVMDVVK
ncbi:UDP-galactose transporter senju [Culicoides brevitarsis]|uniref:UDP-galactose transporter senju n=1 Tax=Culicoides brevitarsis TaxID=469753 RepID=UPI00307BFD4A